MSNPTSSIFYLYETKTQERRDQVRVEALDVFFPDYVRGWSDVLDCRTEPYRERSVEQNCKFALGVHKRFILVAADQFS
jgi:hypothetical protein